MNEAEKRQFLSDQNTIRSQEKQIDEIRQNRDYWFECYCATLKRLDPHYFCHSEK